ncbi:MAG TPA: hypothetical protein O0W91_03215 [Methanocorpusculum sp.]|nr:hypothetical protein [Methanocorpusculum sp.]HJK02252.1 hypothetical protein [Methanocorpusculum sp.]
MDITSITVNFWFILWIPDLNLYTRQGIKEFLLQFPEFYLQVHLSSDVSAQVRSSVLFSEPAGAREAKRIPTIPLNRERLFKLQKFKKTDFLESKYGFLTSGN